MSAAPAPNPGVIAGDEALAAFRQGLTGPRALAMLAAAPLGVLVPLPVGVGKTAWMVKIIISTLMSSAYDLVVVMVPRWDVLRELLEILPADLDLAVLTPRPRKRCGDLDALWVQYEHQGLGILGRAQLCSACPKRAKCNWPRQYGSQLRGVRLILAVQHHLTINPTIITHLQRQTEAHTVLTLIDESTILLRSVERIVRAADLRRFVAAQEAYLVGRAAPTVADSTWLDHSRLLGQAATVDLREGNWQFPWMDTEWATGVQICGLNLFGQDFQFIAHDLRHFARSDRGGRERLPSGDIRFAALPNLGKKFMVFTGSMAKELARYRLDPNHDHPTLVLPFAGLQFRHPGTRWFNLNSLAGAARYFRKNAGRILDFYAAKIARNIAVGKRTLLVSRKMFVPLCRRLLRERLAALHVGPFKIVTGNWRKHDLNDPRVISLINYGVAGLNRFEQVECAYCVNSYYVTPPTVSQAVQDIEASTERYPVRIVMDGVPRRRRAIVDLPDDRMPILPWVAQQALVQMEADPVVQAVGRVRPFTRPREVITFQAGDLPGVTYALEFSNLAQAREYFGITTAVQAGVEARVAQAQRLKAQGLSKRQIARELSVSLSTVKRYLRCAGGGHRTFFLI